MSNNVIVGIGGSGSRIVDLLVNSNIYNSRIFSLIIDTDLEELENIKSQNKIALTKNEKVNDVVVRLGADNIKPWFSVDNDSNKQFLKMLDMHKGTHLWRNNALLAFVDFISDEENIKVLNSYVDEFFEENDTTESNFYLVSSLCGGTGSGLILPFSYCIFLQLYIL